MTADQLYSKGQQLLRRIIAPNKMNAETEFALLKGWTYSVVPRRARVSMEARTIVDADSLISALQDYLSLEGERGEGQTAKFKKSFVPDGRERVGSIVCFKCNKPGHKSSECWQKSSGVPKAHVSGVNNSVSSSAPSSVVVSKVICFTCGIEGHKSPQCPNKPDRGKEARAKPVKMVFVNKKEGLKRVEGCVNGTATSIVLDSGASISIIPDSMVDPNSYTGESVIAKGLWDEGRRLPLAKVPFEIGPLEWVEEVAVAPAEQCKEVLYGLDIGATRGLEIVLLVNTGKTRLEEVNLDLQQRQTKKKPYS